ncbi:MAG: ferrous iron transport protein A [Bacilli bacterium]|nr:ferrous iron transport protein A [Bacilli bacterium]
MPIVIAPIDTELTIVKVLADEKTKRHLESLGVVANGKITVISSRGGNTICVVKGIRLAFNRETASKILVA